MSELKKNINIEENNEEDKLGSLIREIYDPELAAYARKLGEQLRRTQPPFDRAKFFELLDTDPILSNMRFVPEDDE